MNEQHTPAPWVAEHLWNGCIAIKQPGRDARIATIEKHNTAAYRPWPNSIEEAGANACLIAAAPDLLGAALQAVAEVDSMNLGALHPLMIHVRPLRDAIKEATGSTEPPTQPGAIPA